MYGVIDIGSNTIRLNIYKLEDKNLKLILKNKAPVGLASYIVDDRMTMEGMQKAGRTLYEFKEIVDNLNIKELFVFATASLRDIKNSKETKLIIEKMTGLSIDVLSGKEEATLGYTGAMFDTEVKSGLLVDIGGGSTEILEFQGGIIDEINSTKMGSLSTFLKFVDSIFPTIDEFNEIKKYSSKILKSLDKYTLNDPMILGVGGTMRSALKLNNYVNKYSDKNNKISKEELANLIEIYTKDSGYFRKLVLKICPERVHTILPGLAIIEAISKKFDNQGFIISQNGVREGYITKHLSR